MNSLQQRREFLKNCALVCASGCGMATALAGEARKPATPSKLLPLRARAYCGLVCDEQCPLYKASVENDANAKKDVFEKWHWRERFGKEFEAAKVFCYGCKPGDKPRGVNVSACTVRACATDRGLESCLQCQRLAACDKELWKSWPTFYKEMQKLQREYVAAGAFTPA